MSDWQSITLKPDEREDICNHISDVLCWFAGFESAYIGRDDKPNLPYGISGLRDFNFKFKRSD